jgi:hypothetical protein
VIKYFSFEMPDPLPEGLVHNVDVSTRPEPVTAAPFARLALQSHLTPGSTEYKEWQRPLSGVHSIMMEKSA